MKKITFLLLLSIIIVLGTGALAAHKTGFIDLSPVLNKIPFANKIIETNKEVLDDTVVVSPIEKENIQLRKEKSELKNMVVILKGEKTKLDEQFQEMEIELTELRELKKQNEMKVSNTNELVECYKEMKAEAVAKIFESLDDDTVITMLVLLDNEQTAKILALMEPQRVALITQLLLNKKEQQ
ncbi:MAG: hypothetical protein PHI90_05660 [Clostridia bacterium]|nr:hypothetical protein [Clostridia bacterium]MDD4048302.1 hypothetical protein [Clostridia bacterium]